MIGRDEETSIWNQEIQTSQGRIIHRNLVAQQGRGLSGRQAGPVCGLIPSINLL